jgi:hypothetical protein
MEAAAGVVAGVSVPSVVSLVIAGLLVLRSGQATVAPN